MTGLLEIGAPVLAQVAHVVLVLLAAPLLLGGLEWARGRLAGFRPAGPLAQAAATMALLRRQPVVTEGVSVVFRHAPLARLVVLACAAMLVPGFARGMALAPAADLMAVAGLLALARGIEVCAALDAGDARSGHAATLLLRRGAWLEPALVLAAFALSALGEATVAGGTNLDAILLAARDAPAAMRAVMLIVALLLAALAVVDAGDAAREGQDADFSPDGWQAAYGGRDLALLRLGSALRVLAWFGLVGGLLLPATAVQAGALLDWPLGIIGWAARLVLVAALVTAATAARARVRPDRATYVPAASLTLALLAVVMLLALVGRA